MLPYFEWKTIVVGPLTLQVWGMFVALGFFVGAYAAAQFAKRRGDDPKIMYDLSVWMLVAGMIGGRLGHVLFYEFPYFAAHPLEVFALWHGGMSMFGGLIACGIVGMWFLRRRGVDVWRYANIAAFGLPFGIAMGRIGCFLIHDHPGTATDFVLGIRFPDGAVRHDHGLYEVLNGIAMALTFFVVSRLVKKSTIPSNGTGVVHFLPIFAFWYGIFRLVMDAYRTVDTRYFGLTPGQYFGALLALCGIAGFVWITMSKKQK